MNDEWELRARIEGLQEQNLELRDRFLDSVSEVGAARDQGYRQGYLAGYEEGYREGFMCLLATDKARDSRDGAEG